MEAEIITIGTELLLGEIVDTNTSTIARALRQVGLDLYRTTTVGDNAGRIAQAVRESLARADAVITTGGLGPTVDDPTREAIALALDAPLAFHPELWEQIQERFARFGRTPTENNRRQAYLPRGAVAIENPVGTAPGFIVESAGSSVICLPGVPAEMSHLLEQVVIPHLQSRSGLGSVIETRLIHTAGVGESWLDEKIADLEALRNPTVGLSAHPGQVDIRITAKAASKAEASQKIDAIEATLRERLGDAIYGSEGATLATLVLELMRRSGWRLTLVESGTASLLSQMLSQETHGLVDFQSLPHRADHDELESALTAAQAGVGSQAGLGVSLLPQGNRYQMSLLLVLPDRIEGAELSYGGPAQNAPLWAANIALDFARRRIRRMV